MSKQAVYPPGPKGLPALGSVYRLARDPLRFWVDTNRHYGRIAHAKLGFLHVYMLNDPELIEQVLVTHHRECIKDLVSIRELVALVGHGLVTLEGERWRKRRKLSSPALQPKQIASYVDAMVQLTERAVARYHDGEARDFHVDSMRLTLAIAAKTLLGFDVGAGAERIGEIMDVSVEYFTERLFPWQRLVPTAVPTRAQLKFRRAMRDLDEIVYSLITHTRAAQNDDAEHLLAQLMRARDEDGQALTDTQLRDEVITMLVGGHETTALTISYAVYELARHPHVVRRLRAEVDAAATDRPLTAADLGKLPFVEAVVRETLRLYPPAHAMSRKVIEDIELDGYRIAKGSLVALSPYAMHRNPRWFRDPELFQPERWLEGKELPRGVYLPFGDGPRVCIGGHFAMAQAKAVLATLLRIVDFQLQPGYQLELQPIITLRPKGGIPVLVRHRHLAHAPVPPRAAAAISDKGHEHDDREDRSSYVRALASVLGRHPRVAAAFAAGALKHRRLEAEFNARLLAGCPTPAALSFPHMELGPKEYWQRNFFSILFLSIFDAIGIAPARQHLYGMILHAVRGIVTATDNILDDEGKGSVRLALAGGSKVLPNVLVTLMEDSVLHDVLSDLCRDRDAVLETRRALTSALYALGNEESGEEQAIEDVLPPKQLLDEIHRFRGGGLLLLAFVAPEINEPQLRANMLRAKDGVNHIGLALQIIDDLSDFEEDLRRRNHNMLRSWVVWNQPDGPTSDGELKLLPRDMLLAPEDSFPRATEQVMEMAVEMALAGFARLHALGHPADRGAALEIIAGLFKLRGLERLWAVYDRSARRPQPQQPVDYGFYFPH